MALKNLLRYGWLVVRYPRAWRFIDEGFGIAARYQRAKRFWNPHLNCSKSFISSALEELAPTSITVLGSGALLDLPNASDIPTSIKEVRLVDGNPAYAKQYEKLRIAYAARGIALSWRFVNVLDIPDEDLADEVIVSLNLISQLALMSKKHFSPAALHLAQLGEVSRRAAILIGDQSWLSYTPNASAWEEQPACPDIMRWEIPGLEQTKHEQWFWHVAPYGIERDDCGLIHDVHARLFVRPA